MGLRGTCVAGVRWAEEVMASLPDGEVLFSRGKSDYQGSGCLVARLDDGRWAQYEWNYGSCSGCDRWEDAGGYDDEEDRQKKLNEVISADVNREAAFMDAETMGDFLVGCLAKKAAWLTGKNTYDGSASYSYEEHVGLSLEDLLKRVAEEARR
jgi:hypothetical protein